jgi:hypothetical protein
MHYLVAIITFFFETLKRVKCLFTFHFSFFHSPFFRFDTLKTFRVLT